MDSDSEALCLLILLRRRRRRQKRHRRYWVHPMLLLRPNQGQFKLIFEELKQDEDKFFSYFRMSITSFHTLLELLEVHLKHEDTKMRKSIPPMERLAITLRYLSTGCSFVDFEFGYQCGASTARKIVQTTCTHIWRHLRDVCMPELTEDRWLKIADGFNDVANFPNCLGAIDGKHIRIIKPLESGSLYYNYKNYFSLVLLAVCDVNYMFTFVDVGSYGKASDSTIYKNSELFRKMQDGTLSIPQPSPISVNSPPVTYSFVGDEAFGLSENMLRPFSGKHLTFEKRIFNYRLCRARHCIECSFGILSSKWKILNRPLNVSVEFAESIVKACCLLHNFVRERDGFNFQQSLNVIDLEAIERTDMPHRRGVTNRDVLKDYFISEEGALPWQNDKI